MKMTRPECFPCSTFFQSPVRHSLEAFSARPVTRVGPAAFSLGPLPCQPGLVGFPARGANEAVVKKACWKWAPAQIKRGTVRNNPVCCNTVTMGPYLVHAVKQPVLHSMTCPIRETSCNTGASGQKGQCHFSVITSPFTERRTRVNFVGFQKQRMGTYRGLRISSRRHCAPQIAPSGNVRTRVLPPLARGRAAPVLEVLDDE